MFEKAKKHLPTTEEIPTPGGKKTWQANTVESILTNEKYKGDALLQKRYTVDFLTKKTRINDGCEIPQYYVEHSHPAIIAPHEHEFVQEEIKKRKALGNRYSGSAFASKIICGDCGTLYGCKVWHSNDKYRREIYQCNRKFKNVQKCTTPNLTEAEIKRAFVAAFNKILTNKSEIIEKQEAAIAIMMDTSKLDDALNAQCDECTALMELIQKSLRKTQARHRIKRSMQENTAN